MCSKAILLVQSIYLVVFYGVSVVTSSESVIAIHITATTTMCGYKIKRERKVGICLVGADVCSGVGIFFIIVTMSRG